MRIVHICAGWEQWNGAANIARMIMSEQAREGHSVSHGTWASPATLHEADEVWIHCSWMPCLWWAALWGRNVHWMPECSYDPIRRAYHGWKKTLVGPIERFCLRRAKSIVATCEAEKGWIESYLGRNCPPIEVSDIKRFFDLPSVPCAPFPVPRSLHLLYLGRRHPLKGLEYLETAIAQLTRSPFPVSTPARASPSATRFARGICSPQLRVVSNAFGDELEKVWDWCDVLILPTLSDNFGLVIAEALKRGKRVITTDGAPAWGNGNDYGGRLIYLRGFLKGSREERVALLHAAIASLLTCRTTKRI